MKRNFQIRLLILCLAIAATQIISCKKESTGLTDLSVSDDAVENAKIDSILKTGLVGWYPFNGDVLDHSSYHNDVVLNNAKPTKGISEKPNSAYLFDGESSFMMIKNSASLNPKKITLFALFKPTGYYSGTCHYNRIINKGSNDQDYGRYILGYSDQYYYNYEGCFEPVQENFENPFGSYGDGQGTASGATADSAYILKGKWYALIYTYNGNDSKLYLNGKLVSSSLNNPTTFTPNETPLFFGKTQDPEYPYNFKGVIDEIRIYDRPLNTSEIDRLISVIKNKLTD